MEEKKLIEECCSENRIAQQKLFDLYYNKTFSTAMRYLSNFHDTEDVMIAAFTRVFKNINGFEYRGEGSLNKWIKTIVINESIRFLTAKKLLKYEETLEAYESEYTEVSNSGDIDTEHIFRIIKEMPPGYRTVFNMFAIEGYSHNEIAQSLNINVNTSKSQLSKARNFISLALKK